MNQAMITLPVIAALAAGSVLALSSASAADLKAGQSAFDANSCSSCHALSASTIGPSLKDIARRYKGKPVALELAQRIRAGSVGRWGGVPHPAYEGLDENNAVIIAKWILGGAPR
jgi:cytochrome c551/c552